MANDRVGYRSSIVLEKIQDFGSPKRDQFPTGALHYCPSISPSFFCPPTLVSVFLSNIIGFMPDVPMYVDLRAVLLTSGSFDNLCSDVDLPGMLGVPTRVQVPS